MRQHVWQVTVDLMGSDAIYNMDDNAAKVQKSVKNFGVLVEVEPYTNLERSLVPCPV